MTFWTSMNSHFGSPPTACFIPGYTMKELAGQLSEHDGVTGVIACHHVCATNAACEAFVWASNTSVTETVHKYVRRGQGNLTLVLFREYEYGYDLD